MHRLTILLTTLALGACVEEAPIDGRRAFLDDCAGCHGDDARGAGPLGRQLTTVPPDLTGLAANNGGTFPRDQVMSVIDGFNRDSHFSAAMPQFGDGDMGPTVIVETNGIGTPVPERLLALADYLASVQR